MKTSYSVMDAQKKRDRCNGECHRLWPKSSNNADGSVPPFHPPVDVTSVNPVVEDVLVRELDPETRIKFMLVIEKHYCLAKCKCNRPYQKPTMCSSRLHDLVADACHHIRRHGVRPPSDLLCCDHCYESVEAAIFALREPTIQEVTVELRALREEVRALREEVL